MTWDQSFQFSEPGFFNPVLVAAAITKVPWNLLLSSGDWKSEIRVPAWPGPGENPLPGCRWLVSPVSSCGGWREVQRALWGLL